MRTILKNFINKLEGVGFNVGRYAKYDVDNKNLDNSCITIYSGDTFEIIFDNRELTLYTTYSNRVIDEEFMIDSGKLYDIVQGCNKELKEGVY